MQIKCTQTNERNQIFFFLIGRMKIAVYSKDQFIRTFNYRNANAKYLNEKKTDVY